MFRSITFLTVAALFGSALALASLRFAFPTGWIGGLLLIGWTVLSRRRWAKQEVVSGLEPSAPERVLRFYGAGTAMLFGHLVVGLLYPDIDLHVGSGNSLAVDSWVMIVAMIVAGGLFRKDRALKDERDLAITAKGTKTGYLVLVALLVGLSMALGFIPPRSSDALTHFMLGNVLIAVILVSVLSKYATQLIAYASDTKAMHEVAAKQ